MPVADLPDCLEITVGRDDDPVRADDCLEDDGGDRVRAFVLEDLFEVRCSRADGARIGVSRGTAVRVRVEHAHDTRDARLRGPAARVAGERDRAGGCTVVRAVARDDLVPSGVPARELDGVLVRFGAAVREEGHLEITRGDLGQQACECGARLGGHGRADRAELLRLLLDRRDDLRVLVSDGDIDELRGEVQVALAVVIPEVTPFAAGDRDRIEGILYRPGMKDVLLRVRLYLTAELGVRLDRRHYAELSLTRSWMEWSAEASRSRLRSPSCPRARSREDRRCREPRRRRS